MLATPSTSAGSVGLDSISIAPFRMAHSPCLSTHFSGPLLVCDVTAAVVGGAAVLGAASSATGGKAKSATSTSSTAPWAEQQGYLTNGFGQAESLYKNASEQGAYQGAFSAGMNPTQQQGYGALTGYATGAGGTLVNGASTNAGALLGATNPYLNNAQALAANGTPGLNSTAAGALTGFASGQMPGNNGTAQAGVNGMMGATGNAQAILAGTQGDTNGALRTAALAYANNPDIDGQIDAVNRDVGRVLSEQTLPGLNAAASSGGVINSARAGAAEAVARRGAEDRAADNAAAIRTNAYNTGLQTALSNQQQQNTTALTANGQLVTANGALANFGEGQRQFDTTAQLDASGKLGTLDLSGQQLNANTRLSANGQLGQAALAGYDAAATAGGLADANASRFVTAGNAQQAEEQRQLTEAQAQWYKEQQYQQQALENYWKIVGGNYGSTTNGTQTNPAADQNLLTGALGGAAMGMGVANGMGTGGMGSLFGGGAADYSKSTSGKVTGAPKNF